MILVICLLLAAPIGSTHFLTTYNEICGDMLMYRAKFGLYEYGALDDEAGQRWVCNHKIMGIRGNFMKCKLTPKECRMAGY